MEFFLNSRRTLPSHPTEQTLGEVSNFLSAHFLDIFFVKNCLSECEISFTSIEYKLCDMPSVESSYKRHKDSIALFVPSRPRIASLLNARLLWLLTLLTFLSRLDRLCSLTKQYRVFSEITHVQVWSRFQLRSFENAAYGSVVSSLDLSRSLMYLHFQSGSVYNKDSGPFIPSESIFVFIVIMFSHHCQFSAYSLPW